MNSDFNGAKLIKTEYASATLVAGYGKRLGLALDRPDNVVQLNDKNIDYYTRMAHRYMLPAATPSRKTIMTPWPALAGFLKR